MAMRTQGPVRVPASQGAGPRGRRSTDDLSRARVAAIAAVVALLILPLALEVAVVAADRPLLSGHPPFLLQQPRGLEWGGHDFTSLRAFESFLTARGANYERWAKRH